ncbi:MAG: NAD(P)H-dependent oxidoreductase [Bdellovibrionota bacterium]
MQKTLVILGTNREDSNTLKALELNSPFSDYEIVELHKLKLEHFVYDHNKKPNDDFLSVVDKMIGADNIVFATPVYWYAMSGIMKIFFDRFSDLISTSKSRGKALKGKKTFLFSTGYDVELPEGFEVPFKRTSDYFNMYFEKSFYFSVKH